MSKLLSKNRIIECSILGCAQHIVTLTDQEAMRFCAIDSGMRVREMISHATFSRETMISPLHLAGNETLASLKILPLTHLRVRN